MIVALWAGLTDDMKFGAVPVQAEEITIWTPSSTQLESDGEATAFSSVDPRGLRQFKAHNQLIANDG
jgi:hypothetical protein